MARVAWVYLGGDEEGDADEDGDGIDSVMEASIGDYLHDDVYGRVQLVADDTAEGDLIILLEDGEEKRRTCGHLRTIPTEAGPTLPVHISPPPPPEAQEAVVAEVREEQEEVEEDGELTEQTGVRAEAGDEAEAAGGKDGDGVAMYNRVVAATSEQCGLVGLETDACDLYFFKSLVRTHHTA
jgi:hypothetical protein